MKKVLLVVALFVTVLFSTVPSFSNPQLIIEHNGPGNPTTWLVRVSYPAPGIVECIAFGPNNEPLG